MDFEQFSAEFTRIFEKNGLIAYCNEAIIRKFFILTDRMVETNKVMNVTALTTVDKIIPLHYADCVKAAEFIPEGARVLDIGCGGGFPILPLAIVRPDLRLTGLDSTAKKIRYVQSVADELGLSVTTVAARAEELAMDPTHRETYDTVISRAVARLNVLDELCLPYCRVGGAFIAMKGAAGREELAEAAAGLTKLGGQVTRVSEYHLHTAAEEERRVTVQVAKVKATPAAYPRAFGTIKKKPL